MFSVDRDRPVKWQYVVSVILSALGYHEVPEEEKNKLSPAFQLTDKSEVTDKVIMPQNPSSNHEHKLPPFSEDESSQKHWVATNAGNMWTQALLLFLFLAMLYMLVTTGKRELKSPLVSFQLFFSHFQRNLKHI